MDRLISEKQVLDTIADFIKNNYSVAKLILNINAIPSAEPYKGMTNGEVIKAVFPYGKYGTNGDYVHVYGVGGNGCLVFTKDWWNSPYKGEQE